MADHVFFIAYEVVDSRVGTSINSAHVGTDASINS